MTERFKIISFYRFVKINDISSTKKLIDLHIKNKKIKGTIILASEGVNGSISGGEHDLRGLLKYLKRILNIRKLSTKTNKVHFLPFNKMKVRLKNEIVSIGKKNINTEKYSGKLSKPSDWEKIIKKKGVKLLDVRNTYEIEIGSFTGHINPKTKSFRDFPKVIDKLNISKNDNIAMYCTGGIRCEKASAYLKLKGYKNIHQLEGGILNYLEYKQKKKDSLWKGECFVFDKRVTVNKHLARGKYKQCYGCRSPITKKDIESQYYLKGVHCPKCVNLRSDEQKQNSLMRQRQIDIKN